jgi:hypothetical protein
MTLKRKPDINVEIFLDYIGTVFLFLSNLAELRTLNDFA